MSPAIANRFGFRVVAICGSFMASLAVLSAWFLCREQPVMLALFLLYGVLGGVGFGMIYVPAVIAVGFYFDNKRALATGFDINISILNRIFYFILIKIYFT